jgi:hypothetical protein
VIITLLSPILRIDAASQLSSEIEEGAVALIAEFTNLPKERNAIHGAVECGYSVFESRGARYLQLDTYGSPQRQIPGKTSQSIQLNAKSAAQLKRIIESAFPELP